MKAKTINAVITKKVGEWAESIDDGQLSQDVVKGAVVTGGCIASMLLREKVNDFDIYLNSKDLAERVAKYYVQKFLDYRKAAGGIHAPIAVQTLDDKIKVIVKSAGIASDDDSVSKYEYFEGRPPEEAQAYVSEVMDDPAEIADALDEVRRMEFDETETFRPVFLSSNAITLSGKVQIIVRFFGPPDEIHKNYDFVHCTNYWTKETGLVLHKAALESLITKELRYVGSLYPLCSIIRARKFIARQWTINAGQYVKMAFQISKLDLSDVEVLEDQLIGVDVAYFHEVIDQLRKKDSKRVDQAYLLEILDRMF